MSQRNSQVSALRQQSKLAAVLSEFQQKLSQDQKDQLDASANTAPSAQDVLQLIQDIEKANKGRKSREIASQAERLLGPVQQYSTIVDTYVGPNQIAALVWGSLKICLLAWTQFSDYYHVLSERVQKLSGYCPRLLEYELLFPASTRLQQALSDFHGVVIEFCSKALDVIQERGIKRFSKSFLRSFKLDFADIESKMQMAKDEVKEEIQLTSEQTAMNFRGMLAAQIEENNIFRKRQEEEMEQMDLFRAGQSFAQQEEKAWRIQRLERETERQRIRLIRKIPNYDYTTSFRRAKGLRCEGTCEWIWGRPEFAKWRDVEATSGLCYHGIPGCGKTLLAAYIVDRLKLANVADEQTAVIYHFFDSSNKDSLNMLSFLRSLLHQVLKTDLVTGETERRLRSLFVGHRQLIETDATEIRDLFIYFSRRSRRKFLIVDGLDEVHEVEKKFVKDFLRGLAIETRLSLLCFTHPDVDVSRIFLDSQVIQISSKDLRPDIELFVQTKMGQYAEELSVCSASQLAKINEVLLSGAEGMFLWVDLLIKAIVDACEEDGTPESIPNLFEQPPRQIADLYRLAIDKISRADRERADMAKRALRWVMYSRQPLSVEEIEEAISVLQGQKSWARPRFKLNLTKLCKICGNLVSFDNLSHTISLAHHTVESFLLNSTLPDVASIGLDMDSAENYLLEICLTYLSFTDFCIALERTPDTRNLLALNYPLKLASPTLPDSQWRLRSFKFPHNRLKSVGDYMDLTQTLKIELAASRPIDSNPPYIFFDYCKKYWHCHTRFMIPQEAAGFKLLKEFVLGDHFPSEWKPWNCMQHEEHSPAHWNFFNWTVREGNMALFNIWELTPEHEKGQYWSRFWSNNGDLVFRSACRKGDLVQLEILLRAATADLKKLVEAEIPNISELGHVDVLDRFLMEDDLVSDEFSGVALILAPGHGHLEFVDRLLKIRPRPRAYSNGINAYADALVRSLRMGHPNVARRLLREYELLALGLNYPQVEKVFTYAKEVGCMPVLETLFQSYHPFAYSLSPRGIRTAFNWAVNTDNIQIVERVLQGKNILDLGFNSQELEQAYYWAVRSGHLQVVECILSGEVNDHLMQTVLNHAIESGNLERTKSMLQKGADANKQARSPLRAVVETALSAALRCKNIEIMQCLLQANAHQELKSPMPYELYEQLARNKNIAGVKFLLKAGADASVQFPGKGYNALSLAINLGSFSIVRYLLRVGVNTNALTSKELRALLQELVFTEDVDMLKLLIVARTDSNISSSIAVRRILQQSVKFHRISSLQSLLEAGIDIHAPASPQGETTLQQAARMGLIDILEYLLETGADVNAPGSLGHREAQREAEWSGKLHVLQHLADSGEDMEKTESTGGGTALQQAAYYGKIYAFERLLKAGADVNAPASPENGYTALQAAVSLHHTAILERLLSEGADVNAPGSPVGGQTALQKAAYLGDADVLRRLLEAGADVNAPAALQRGYTALQAAAHCGHRSILRQLLEAGADVNAVGSSLIGRTALQAAAYSGHTNILEDLLNGGADVNAPASMHRGYTALQAAAHFSRVQMVKRLLKAGADVNAPGSPTGGKTAVQAATRSRCIDVLEFLIAAGADVNAPSSSAYGYTALEDARVQGYTELEELLLKAGAV